MVKALKRNQIIIFAIALMLITAGYLSYTMNTEQTAETSAPPNGDEYAAIGDARLVSNDDFIDVSSENGLQGEIAENDKTENSASSNDENSKSGNENSTNLSNNKLGNANNTNLANDKLSDTNNNTNLQNNNQGSQNKQNAVSETSAKNISSGESKELDAYFTESKLERDKMFSEMLESYQSMLGNQNVSSEQKSLAQAEISKINKQRNAIMIAENLIKNKGFKDIVIFVNNDSVSAVIRAEKLETADIAQAQSIIQRELLVNVENIHISNK